MDFLSSSSVINSLSSLLEESRNASESTTEFVAPVALETTLKDSVPMSVKHEKSNAKFDPKKEVLTVVLPIDDGLGL
eukprot:gene36415-47415_t